MRKFITFILIHMTLILIPLQAENSWNPELLYNLLNKEWDFVNKQFNQLFDPQNIDLNQLTSELQTRGVSEHEISQTLELLQGIINNEYTSLGEMIDMGVIPEYGFIETLGLITASEALILEESAEIVSRIQKLSKGVELFTSLAEATAFSSTAASLTGYTDHEKWAVALGSNVSIEGSLRDLSTMATMSSQEYAEEELPLPEGFSFQGITANISFPLRILSRRASLFVKIGATNVTQNYNRDSSVALWGVPLYRNQLIDYPLDLELSTITLGTGFSYNLFNNIELTNGLYWRGLTLNSGIIYNNYKLSGKGYIREILSPDMYTPEENITLSLITDNHTLTMPLDVSTGIKISSFINLSFSLGADISWASSYYNMDITHDDLLLVYFTESLLKNLTVDMLSTQEENIISFYPRISAGIGLGFEKYYLDITGYWYIEKGYSLNSSLIIQFQQ